MSHETVKGKLSNSGDIQNQSKSAAAVTLLLIALLSFILSTLSILPSRYIERWFAHGAFPKISTVLGFVGDALPIAWFDVLVTAGLIYTAVSIRQRRWFRI